MAYSNWGAKVYYNGQARHDRCDTHPEQITNFNDENLDVCYFDLSGHAVIGDEEMGIMLIIYKYYIKGYCLRYYDGKWEFSKTPNDIIKATKEDNFYIETHDKHTNIRVSRDNGVITTTMERVVDDVRKEWTAVCGQSMGEGWEEWD